MPKKPHVSRTVYRDSKTGRFVKKSTWKRSKARGGERYKREKIKPPKIKAPPPARAREWIVTFSYTTKKGKEKGREKTVDFTVIAASREEAQALVNQAIAQGQDSNGADTSWTTKIPWDQIFVTTPEEMGEQPEAPPEALTGYVSVR